MMINDILLKSMFELQEEISFKNNLIFETKNELKEINKKMKEMFEKTSFFIILNKNFDEVHLDYIDESCFSLILNEKRYEFIDLNIIYKEEKDILKLIKKFNI